MRFAISQSNRKPIYSHLYFQVLVAIAAGILLGYFFPGLAAKLKPLGDAFIKLIKMMIAPIIFTTVVVGIARIGNLKDVGRVGLKSIIYFELVSSLAWLSAWCRNLAHSRDGFTGDVSTLDAKALASYTTGAKSLSTVDFFLHMIPDSVVGAFAGGEILQVLLFSVLFGLALARLGKKGKTLVDAIDQLSHALFNVIAIVMRFAPIGAFGAMAFTIGAYGAARWFRLALMACVYLTCLLFVFVVSGTIARLRASASGSFCVTSKRRY